MDEVSGGAVSDVVERGQGGGHRPGWEVVGTRVVGSGFPLVIL